VAAAAVLAGGTAAVTAPVPPLRVPQQWCGTETAADQPDAVAALQIHVVYAIPADAADRFGERVLPILSDLTAAESWWQAQDSSRELRLDLLTVPCDSSMGRVDITAARLPNVGSFYDDPQRGFERLVGDLQGPAGLNSPDKKYLVYYDGAVVVAGICGTSPNGPRYLSSAAVVYLDSLCGDDLGSGGKAAATAVHELLHNLGADPHVHACAGSPGHVCDDRHDILYPRVEEGVVLGSLRLDVGHDDYYALQAGSAGSWDVRRSPFLERPQEAQVPPTAVGSLRATTAGTRISLTWTPAKGSDLVYRVYRDGRILTQTRHPAATDVARGVTAVAYTVRAMNGAGLLGRPAAVTVQAGL